MTLDATAQGGSPDDLLAQIADLVQQYMADPGADPTALDQVVQEATAGAGDMPDAGAPQGNLADALGAGAPPEAGPPPRGDPFKAATAAAMTDIGAAQDEAGTKTGIPEQFGKKKRQGL